MASIAEILTKEFLFEPKIYLYKEGIFWKAYQYSAFRVMQYRADFKLKKKYVKTVSSEVVSLGFPEGTLKQIFDDEKIEKVDEKTICISVGDNGDINIEKYEGWFESVLLADQNKNTISSLVKSITSTSSQTSIVLRKIKEFPIEQSTPMDCMNFLVMMRKELTEYGYI